MKNINITDNKYNGFSPCWACESNSAMEFTEDNIKCKRCDYFVTYALLEEIVGGEDKCRFCLSRDETNKETGCMWGKETSNDCNRQELDLEAIYNACTMA